MHRRRGRFKQRRQLRPVLGVERHAVLDRGALGQAVQTIVEYVVHLAHDWLKDSIVESKPRRMPQGPRIATFAAS